MSASRTVALCYVRLSFTKDANDLTSPERQKANLLRACEKHGWTPEWYEDVQGHKSATREHNRPAWEALKTRLKDPDVAALVVNEQSRAMRNAWRAIKLFEELPAYGVVLHLAALDRTIDITTPDGRMSAYIQAFLDDLYALDAKRRSLDSIRYRKERDITIGIPPFGTVRGDKGHLVKSSQGAWLLPDGRFEPGTADHQPHPEALWRGYADCAARILTLYKDNQHGYGWIADELNRSGWSFRDRWGKPRPFTLDDVRRVVSNWREYAGLVTPGKVGKARDRIASKIENPTAMLHDTGRAVFPMELLADVARVQEHRSIVTRPAGSVSQSHIFPLSFVTYCAHCDEMARSQDNPRLRARITGHNKNGELRYRHADHYQCGGKRRSLPAHVIEGDFARLIDALEVHPDAVQLMAELAVQSRFGGANDEDDLIEQKRVATGKHRRALKNNLILFQSGEIDQAEYYRQKDYHERQIAHWEAQTTDRQQIALELMTTLEMVKRLKQFWDVTEGEDRRLLAHSLFEEIVYDLDRQRIVDFKLLSWAEPFLVMRAALQMDDMGEEMKNRFNSGSSSHGQFCSPNGRRTHLCIQLAESYFSAN